MATKVPENWGWVLGPRISFSHDLSQSDLFPSTDAPRADASLPLDSAAEFDFSVSIEIADQDPSPADEIFSNGKILPLPLPIKSPADKPANPPPTKPNPEKKTSVSLSLREAIDTSDKDDDKTPNGHRRQSFWRLGRSSSDGHRTKTGMISCPFPLTRSKSVGSFPNTNPIRKPPQPITGNGITGGRNGSLVFRPPPPARKGGSDDGIRIRPILNLPRGGSNKISSKKISSSSSTSVNNTSVLAYLLCNCKDKEHHEEERT